MGGGRQPRWSPDGGVLYYLDADRLFSVTVDSGPPLVVGQPTIFFEAPFEGPQRVFPNYDVDPRDGSIVAVIAEPG